LPRASDSLAMTRIRCQSWDKMIGGRASNHFIPISPEEEQLL
jgi:hypothetical protein